MGIYIPGVEAPKDCAACPAVSCYWRCDGKSRHCPIVSVPDHGRLGDLDALRARIKPPSSEDETWAATGATIRELFSNLIDSADTIIPAEPGKGGRAVNDDEEQLALFEGAEQKPKIPDAQREKRRWENRFQEWSNEQALSGLTHYGACGYGAICNYCDGDPKGRACVRALNEMLRTKRLSIDYKATTYEQAFDGQIGREAAS